MTCVVRKITKGLNWNIRQQPAELCEQGWSNDVYKPLGRMGSLEDGERRGETNGRKGLDCMKFGFWQTSGQCRRRRVHVAQHYQAEWKRRSARTWRTFFGMCSLRKE